MPSALLLYVVPASQYFDIQADMTCYGKTLGGGMPNGICCGPSLLSIVTIHEIVFGSLRPARPTAPAVARGDYQMPCAFVHTFRMPGSISCGASEIVPPLCSAPPRSSVGPQRTHLALFRFVRAAPCVQARRG